MQSTPFFMPRIIDGEDGIRRKTLALSLRAISLNFPIFSLFSFTSKLFRLVSFADVSHSDWLRLTLLLPGLILQGFADVSHSNWLTLTLLLRGSILYGGFLKIIFVASVTSRVVSFCSCTFFEISFCGYFKFILCMISSVFLASASYI
ncbi:hypothetical protein Hanom_Chr02g00097531 [Helianthus anomalus]